MDAMLNYKPPPNTKISNDKTGANSSNNSSSNSSNETNLSNTNNAKIINNINVTSNTGANSSSYNTGGGSIISGNASVGINIANFINTNVVAKKFAVLLVNVFGSWAGVVVPPGQEIPKTADSSQNDSSSQNQENQQSQITVTTHGNMQEITTIQTSVNQNQEKTVFVGSTNSFSSFNGGSISEESSKELFKGLFVSENFLKNIEEKNTGFSLPKLFGGKNVVDVRWLIISLSLWGIITLLRKYPAQIAYRIKYLYQFFLEVML